MFLVSPFVVFLLIDAIITINLILHMNVYTSNEKIFTQIGIWYFFFYPGIGVLSPILGIISQILCRTFIFKFFVMVTSLSCLFNLSITLILQIVFEDRVYYILEVVIVIFLRIIQCNLANYQIALFEDSKSLAATKTRL